MKTAKQILREKPTHVAGWGLSLSAALLACVVFPAIAANSSSARVQLTTVEAERSAKAFLSAREITKLDPTALQDNFANKLTQASLSEEIAKKPAGAELIAQAAHTHAEHICLSQAVFFEARSEGRAGQKAVAEVVLNRVKSRHYPNTVCGVVFQGAERSTGCQFSFTCDGSLDRAVDGKMWIRSSDIAALAMTGGFAPLTDRATHYHNLDVTPIWSDTLVMTKTVGTHKFYRTKWRERNISRSAILAAPPSP